MAEREEGPEISGIVAIALGVIAWVSFLLAFFMASDPFWFLAFALVCGGIALAIGVRARREEATAAAVGGAAAGAALLWGVSVVAALTAMVYAMGVLLLLVMIFFFAVMFGASSASSSSGGCTCGSGGGSGGGCCEDCCDDCGGSCCDCGAASCCDCGGCGGCDCGGCGGCGCIGFGMVLPPVRQDRAARWRNRFAHHPDTEDFAPDVYLVKGLRLCIGCFTTYPVFLAASALLATFPPASTPALLVGATLALAQGISSAGLARARWIKATVKTCLGLGLALVVAGILSAAWLPQLKVLALVGVLALAWLSALPRARRMSKARPSCAHGHRDVAADVPTTTAP